MAKRLLDSWEKHYDRVWRYERTALNLAQDNCVKLMSFQKMFELIFDTRLSVKRKADPVISEINQQQQRVACFLKNSDAIISAEMVKLYGNKRYYFSVAYKKRINPG